MDKFVYNRSWLRISQTRHGLMAYNINDQFIGKSLDTYGEWCYEEFNALDYDGKVVVDIGANIGTHTLEFSKKAKHVFAFEPHPYHYALLTTNIVLNTLENVDVYNIALSYKRDTVYMKGIDPHLIYNYGSTQIDAEGEIARRAYTLDGYLPTPVDLIKIDAEGHEYEILCGAMETIRKYKPVLYVECDRKDQFTRVTDLIESYGYAWKWHLPFLYNPHNFKGVDENIFKGIWSEMLLCTPK